MKWIKRLFTRPETNTADAVYLPCVTLGWDMHPTLQLEGGYVLPRRAEMVINQKYYPHNKIGEWLVDPESGEKLPMAEY